MFRRTRERAMNRRGDLALGGVQPNQLRTHCFRKFVIDSRGRATHRSLLRCSSTFSRSSFSFSGSDSVIMRRSLAVCISVDAEASKARAGGLSWWSVTFTALRTGVRTQVKEVLASCNHSSLAVPVGGSAPSSKWPSRSTNSIIMDEHGLIPFHSNCPALQTETCNTTQDGCLFIANGAQSDWIRWTTTRPRRCVVTQKGSVDHASICTV